MPGNVREYNIYQLDELLQKLADKNPETDEWERDCRVVVSANPS
ncbi:type VI secretion system baseplate subunit TssG, partial [Vibrio cholerae O1]|nr:type VI secretion system baseplate subunit TssG [Vibrio cholerae O1]